MDLYKAIDELRAEQRRLDEIIAQLETLRDQAEQPAKRRRVVRKRTAPKTANGETPPVPGLDVSEKMVQYWRENAPETPADSSAQPSEPEPESEDAEGQA